MRKSHYFILKSYYFLDPIFTVFFYNAYTDSYQLIKDFKNKKVARNYARMKMNEMLKAEHHYHQDDLFLCEFFPCFPDKGFEYYEDLPF